MEREKGRRGEGKEIWSSLRSSASTRKFAFSKKREGEEGINWKQEPAAKGYSHSKFIQFQGKKMQKKEVEALFTHQQVNRESPLLGGVVVVVVGDGLSFSSKM
jgi:hypothetical protein